MFGQRENPGHVTSAFIYGLAFILGASDAGVIDTGGRSSLNFTGGSPASTDERCRQADSEYQHAVIVDAGSSGSRVHVYRWPRSTAGRVEASPGAVQGLGPTLKIRPGLSSIADDALQVRDLVARLLRNASAIVPPQLHAYTPVYFMATAGMRVLLESRMNSVMTYVDSLMLDVGINPFRYDSLSSSRVLSGEEEAVFEWIAVNYLLGNLAAAAGDRSFVGVVEMGGASLQLAFLPAGDVMADMFPVHVTGQQYSLYAHSYLGLGINQVIERVQQLLLAGRNTSSSDGATVPHPCMLTGDSLHLSGTTFVGTGHPWACAQLLRDHVVYKVKDASRCRPKPCAIGPVYQPSLPGGHRFYAVGGALVFTLRSIGSVDENDTFVPRVGYQKAVEACQLGYNEAMAQFGEIDPRFVTHKCLTGMYISLLLNQGLGFHNDSSVIQVPSRINGENPGWTLGAVLYENAQIRYQCQFFAQNDDDNDN